MLDNITGGFGRKKFLGFYFSSKIFAKVSHHEKFGGIFYEQN